MIWKTSLLVRFEILGLFVNPLATDAKYSHENTATNSNALISKAKLFSRCFIAFVEFIWNFEYF